MKFEKPIIHTVQIESESTVFLCAKIWDLIPENIKYSKSEKIFKSKIKE